MKSSNIKGWQEIFRFTFAQMIKSKGYRISLAILIVIALFGMPVFSYFTLGTETDTEIPITKAYVFDSTGLMPVDFTPVTQTEGLGNVEFIIPEESYETVAGRVDKEEPSSVIVKLGYDVSQGFTLEILNAKDGEVSSSDMHFFGEQLVACFNGHKIEALGLTKEQVTLINAPVISEVYQADSAGNAMIEEDTSITMNDYWFVYGLIFAVMMINIMASSQIATSIISDKSSKVIEYLLTSVKPMAILVGKILAMLCAVLIQVVIMIVAIVASSQISTKITGKSNMDILGQMIHSETLNNLNVINVLICLIVFALSLIFYAMLAGLAGSTVSKIQEASDSLTIFTLVSLVGAYMAMGAAGTLAAAGQNAYVYFALLFPISSSFLLPGAILIGKASIPIAVGAIVLQIVFIVLLLKFTSTVYETLILHNGNKIGIKQLFRIAKMAKGGQENE